MGDPEPPSAVDLLQVCTVIASLALTLGTLLAGQGGDPSRWRLAGAAALMFAGLVTTIGAMYALFDLWEDEEMGLRDFVGLGHWPSDFPHAVLFLAAWGFVVFVFVYVAMFGDAARVAILG